MKMTMTASGDSILVQGYEKGGYDGFKEVKDFLNRGQAKFGNLEICITDNDTYAAADCGGLWQQTEPRVLKQIADFGFDFMGFANNHTMDYGPDGMRETLKYANQAGIALAGAGESMTEAAAPVYRDFKGGRVAFISTTSLNYPNAARAGYPSKTVQKGRPGVNILRFNQHFTVTKEHFAVLKEIAKTTYMNGQRDKSRSNGFDVLLGEDELDFGGIIFKLTENGKEEKVNHPNKTDMERIRQAVADAAKIADYVVVMFHSHQIKHDEMCEADFYIEEFSRSCIDAGADVILGGGTHEFKGIEIYKNKPIFYSLGNFCFQLNTFLNQPYDLRENYGMSYEISDIDALDEKFAGWKNGLWVQKPNFRSVIPYLEFEDGKLVKAEMQPIELGFSKPKHLKGLPFIAEKDEAKVIFETLKSVSEVYGTKLKLKDNGIIEICLKNG